MMRPKEFFKRNKSVVHNGVVYALDEKDFLEIVSTWIGENDPGTWVCSEVVTKIKVKWPELPRAKVIALAAAVLGKTVDNVEGMLEWNAQYVSWHDGTPYEDNHPYPPNEP